MEFKKTAEYFSSLPENVLKKLYSGPWTPFHSALVTGNLLFLNKLFEYEAIQSKPVRYFMCNALVDYSKEWEYQEELILEKLKCVVGSQRNDIIKRLIHRGSRSELNTKTCDLFTGCKRGADDLNFETPLALACVSGQLNVVNFLLKNGASVWSTDLKGNTIFHSLAFLAKHQPLTAVAIYQKLVREIESVDDKHDLVRALNKEGSTALDLAAKKMCFDYVLALYHTDGVYRFINLECGAIQHVLYDISRYECTTSTEKVHFLHHLAMIHEDELHDLHRCQILEKEPFKSWFTSKLQKYHLKCIMWYMTWVILIGLFCAQTAVYYSNEDHPIHKSLAVILLIYAAVITFETIMFVISERDVYLVTLLKCTKKGFPVANKSYYVLFHLVFVTTVVVIECLHISERPCHGNLTLYVSLYVFAAEYGCLSFMLFTQFYPKGGHLVTLIDRMVWDVFLFLLIWGIIFNSFTLAFYILHIEPSCNQVQMYSNATTAPTDMFSTFKNSFYETILLALQILPPRPLHFEHATAHWLAGMVYSSFLLLVPLVLTNLIIAIMTQKVSALNRYQHTIHSLQKLFLALFMERISSFRLIPLNPFKSIQDKVDQKYLLVSEDRTHMFIKVVEEIPHLRQASTIEENHSYCTHL